MPLVAFWDSPTAQMSVAETMATPKKRLASVLGLGLETTLQLLPFHCSISVPLPLSPTAHTSLVETAATPKRSLNAPSGLGLATMLHCLPFQCSMRVCETPLALEAFPTAHTSLVETAATAWSPVPTVEGFFTTLHLWPFQCSISACPPPLVGRKEPTAHTSLVATAATPRRLPSTMPVVGLATTLQAAACATAGARSRASSTTAT